MSDDHPETGGAERDRSNGAGKSPHDNLSGWELQIFEQISSDYVILGVGSRLRGDDAAGPMVATELSERGVENCFDCGNVPENYLGKIEKVQPADMIFVDAADCGEDPGVISFHGGEHFDYQSISTHSAGLSPLMDYLAESCPARCWVLSIQPKTMDYGAEVSKPVKEAIERIVSSDVWMK